MIAKNMKMIKYKLQINFFRIASFSWKEENISFTEMMMNNSSDINPFFNQKTAYLKKEFDSMKEQIKDWQSDFKIKYKRKPTLEEMMRDKDIGPIIKSLDDQKKALKASIYKYRIN